MHNNTSNVTFQGIFRQHGRHLEDVSRPCGGGRGGNTVTLLLLLLLLLAHYWIPQTSWEAWDRTGDRGLRSPKRNSIGLEGWERLLLYDTSNASRSSSYSCSCSCFCWLQILIGALNVWGTLQVWYPWFMIHESIMFYLIDSHWLVPSASHSSPAHRYSSITSMIFKSIDIKIVITTIPQYRNTAAPPIPRNTYCLHYVVCYDRWNWAVVFRTPTLLSTWSSRCLLLINSVQGPTRKNDERWMVNGRWQDEKTSDEVKVE